MLHCLVTELRKLNITQSYLVFVRESKVVKLAQDTADSKIIKYLLGIEMPIYPR